MHQLQKMLANVFKAPAKKRVDRFAHTRSKAKKLANQYGITIYKEIGQPPAWSVYPPEGIEDRFADDHYCLDWTEVLALVEEYVKDLKGD